MPKTLRILNKENPFNNNYYKDENKIKIFEDLIKKMGNEYLDYCSFYNLSIYSSNNKIS